MDPAWPQFHLLAVLRVPLGSIQPCLVTSSATQTSCDADLYLGDCHIFYKSYSKKILKLSKEPSPTRNSCVVSVPSPEVAMQL